MLLKIDLISEEKMQFLPSNMAAMTSHENALYTGQFFFLVSPFLVGVEWGVGLSRLLIFCLEPVLIPTDKTQHFTHHHLQIYFSVNHVTIILNLC